MSKQAGRITLKNYNFAIIVFGSFIIGFVISMIIFTSSAFKELEESVQSIQEIAQSRKVEELDFYRISYADLSSWLESTELQSDEDFDTNLATVGSINNTADLILYFDDQTDAVNNVLSTVYHALAVQTMGPEATPQILPTSVEGEEEVFQPITVCLAVDSDPYSATGPGLFVYIEVDADLSDEMGEQVKEGWEELPEPKENSMTWASECYDPATDASSSEESES